MSCKHAKIIIFWELLDINIQNINQHLMFCLFIKQLRALSKFT